LSIKVLLVIVGPCPVRVSHRDFRIRRPVRSFSRQLSLSKKPPGKVAIRGCISTPLASSMITSK
jgi:hypothetical protein